ICDLDSVFCVLTKFVITGYRFVVISCERAQLWCHRIVPPLLIRPRSPIDPVPLLTDTKIEITIEMPVAFRLFTHLKSPIRVAQTQLIRRPHFEIGGDQRIYGHRDPSISTRQKFNSENELSR